MMTAEQRAENERITFVKVRQMFAIPTFTLMLIQRLLSGHLLIASFGIVFLVQEYRFNTAVAAVVTLPFGIGYLIGTFGGGLATDALQRRFPRAGRIGVLQFAQLGFGVAALIATQFDWGSIGIFAALWAVMGFMQGLNPGVNRPIVAAVVPPELRGAAFALMLSGLRGACIRPVQLDRRFPGGSDRTQAGHVLDPRRPHARQRRVRHVALPHIPARLGSLLLARTKSVPTTAR